MSCFFGCIPNPCSLYSALLLTRARTVLGEKKVLYRTEKCSSAVPIGHYFWFQVEPFLVPGRTLSTEGFYIAPKRVLPGTKGVLHGTRNGSPMGTAEEPFWNPFFLRVQGGNVASLDPTECSLPPQSCPLPASTRLCVGTRAGLQGDIEVPPQFDPFIRVLTR